MGLMDKLERGLEKAVKSPFARVFKAEVQPVEIASAMRGAMDDRAAVLGPGRTMTPNVFTVELAPTDFERLSSHGSTLLDELVAAAEDHCDQQRYSTPGPIEVRLDSDDELETGIFRVRPSSKDGRGRSQPGPGQRRAAPERSRRDDWGAGSSGTAAAATATSSQRPQYDEGPEQYVSNSPAVEAHQPPRVPRREDREEASGAEEDPYAAFRPDAEAPGAAAAPAPESAPAPPAPSGARASGVGYFGPDDDADEAPARAERRDEPEHTRAVAPPSTPAPQSRPPRPPKAWLEIDGRQHPLRRAVTTLGRDGGVDVVLDDTGASRRHAEIRFTHDGPRSIISVRDLGSTNGTYVNGDAVTATQQLREGDRLTVGRTHVIFHVEDR